MTWYLISPTGKGIRKSDSHGSGEYGASRGANRYHTGVDFICEPGQIIVSPCQGKIVRVARPYATGYWLGVLIRNEILSLFLFYLIPHKELIGQEVRAGHDIGIAQDISVKYPGITPHIHMQIESIDPGLFLKPI